MFNNVGGKIKGVAIVYFIIGFISSFIGGILLISEGGELAGLIGLLVLFLGILSSLVVSWFLYAYGEIVDILKDIKETTQRQTKVLMSMNQKPLQNKTTEPVQNSQPKNYYCTKCGKEIDQNTKFCPNCGQQFDWKT